MPKKKKTKACCTSLNQKITCCKVESVVSIDDRGQMVLPKEIRQKANIKSGDKLALVSMEKEGNVCCLSLIKINEIEHMVKGMLGPVMKEIL